jgi:hypothetical protein
MLILFYASIRKKDGEMMKKSSSCTSINSQVRNEYNYSAGLNVLNTYRNNMATFPQQLHCKLSSGHYVIRRTIDKKIKSHKLR